MYLPRRPAKETPSNWRLGLPIAEQHWFQRPTTLATALSRSSEGLQGPSIASASVLPAMSRKLAAGGAAVHTKVQFAVFGLDHAEKLCPLQRPTGGGAAPHNSMARPVRMLSSAASTIRRLLTASRI